ncbi:MAG TPA: hydantoinase/oxoprolinase family protein [Deltaproteobacteria bacterium]|nr:hydantoinase/oxoprolinase family protein [Deltaproteobacteria bacterium]
MYTIDIDVGGTQTDGVFTDGREITEVKVDTTPHDLTVCFIECLSQGAKQLGFETIDRLMKETKILRWSSTITTNVLAERRGPKLGLMVTKGNKINLYHPDVSPALGLIIDEDNIIEIEEDPTEDEVLLSLKKLLEKGVRRIVISLKGGKKERDVRQWIEEQYPDHYLGAVPVVVGSEICKHPDDATRTHYAMVNSYTHGPLAASLFKAEDQIKYDYGFKGNLLVGLNRGGTCQIAKAKAIDTVESGPVLGIFGSARLSKYYDLTKVCSFDMGGTTAKFGIIHNFEPVYSPKTEFFGIPLDIPSVLLRSVSVGGGTIVKGNAKTGDLVIGPESKGAYPGPACYDLGGTEATITDAMLILGFINPDNFLSGKRRLRRENAEEAIDENVAKPLGISTATKAAKLILERVLDSLAMAFENTFKEINENSLSDYTMFAFGGNGGLFAALLAERLGISQVKVFRFGSVFSALASSMTDVVHVYEEFLEKKVSEIDRPEALRIIDFMMREARQDLQGEGFDPNKANYSLEIDIIEDANSIKVVSFDKIEMPFDLGKLLEEVTAKHGDVWVKTLRVRSRYEIAKYEPVKFPYSGEAMPKEAVSGKRTVLFTECPVFKYDMLKHGNVINGPAIVEGGNTTYYVPEGWVWRTDEYHNATLKLQKQLEGKDGENKVYGVS